jgi:hypothetical protein
MKYYRILLNPLLEADIPEGEEPPKNRSVGWRGLLVTDQPQFIQTPDKLDINKLYDEGLSVKEFPGGFPEKDIKGRNIKPSDLKAK